MDFIDAELVSIYSNSVKHFMEIDVCHILLKNQKTKITFKSAILSAM
jgi:hypothetical protein